MKARSRVTPWDELTHRELEVLTLVASGRSNAEISKHLWLSHQTIKFHLTNLYRKLGVHNRTEAALFAYRTGLLKIDQLRPDELDELRARLVRAMDAVLVVARELENLTERTIRAQEPPIGAARARRRRTDPNLDGLTSRSGTSFAR